MCIVDLYFESVRRVLMCDVMAVELVMALAKLSSDKEVMKGKRFAARQ
jgi:hypothetical protein